jgi:hypothetical protein
MRSRGAERPKFCDLRCPQKIEGAGKAGCPSHPQSCAKMHTADRRCAGTPGLPCAVALRLMPRSPRSRIPLASVADGLTIDRSPVGPDNLHRLDTSNGCQDHAVLPSAASSSHPPQPARMLPEKVSTEAFKRRSSARCARSRKTRPANTSRARRCRVHRNPSQRS